MQIRPGLLSLTHRRRISLQKHARLHLHSRTPPRPSPHPHAPPPSLRTLSARTMSSGNADRLGGEHQSSGARDVSGQSDIGKMKTEKDGTFARKASTFRDTVAPGGKFPPEKGRYRLYVSYACPWATRTLIVRKLKGLEDIISVSVVSPHMGEHGWPFASADAFPGADTDPEIGAQHVKDLYFRAQPDYDGRFTVPVLWDRQTGAIVNNESSEIIRMFYGAFDGLLPAEKRAVELYPEHLRKEIDGINEWVYDRVNNGVYKCGFATSQEAYEANVFPLFESLDRLEKLLDGKKYLVGEQLTEADVRLFPTIVRFDPVYVGHFKCNLRTIRDGYPNLHRWMRNLYWNEPAFKETTNFEHIKVHYYWSQTNVNPSRVVAVGPKLDILPLDK